ncbi:pyridoxine/pyridoxal/pyridoxamine kinase [Culicoidibacter larvae]|uniref:pyridoxal kinase n=1 Tax=Culicoidibacter larvae TaxID=2579976 RepID=A0A5R8QA69_9FIRM|nr:pyridoxine/pyridoxal/pyridoxamine kinase [Culicoidibacter larvae]TLG71542.1 pyridoxine/pyridoxal/pyridoxamine kinase [Culicoidibacter larvae]
MTPKKVLTIAGSDTSGGAGIQADLKTFQERDVYGMTALTVIVAMDPDNGWAHQVFPIETEIIKAQLATVLGGIGIDALKTGMLPTVEIITLVGKTIQESATPIVVIDPVMVCKGADQPLFPENTTAMQTHLLPYATVVTPNLFEAAQLAGMAPITTLDEMKTAAEKIAAFGTKYVVVKGGKVLGGAKAIDLLYDGETHTVFESEKIDTTYNHGAGCTFSACITAELAKGADIFDAVQTAKTFVTEALRDSFPLNEYVGPLYHKALAKK